jgi:hypothetical protein
MWDPHTKTTVPPSFVSSLLQPLELLHADLMPPPYARELTRRPTKSQHKAALSSPSPRVAAKELVREAM